MARGLGQSRLHYERACFKLRIMTRVKIGNTQVDLEFKEEDLQPIRMRTPIRTGLLRRSWQIQDRDSIVNTAPYSVHVEFGVLGRPGLFIFERSLPEIVDKITQRLVRDIDSRQLVK